MNGRELEAARDDGAQLLDVVGDAAARAAEGEGRADDERIADLRGELLRVVDRRGVRRLRHLDADRRHALLEELPVLGGLDGLVVRADQLHAVALERAVLVEGHGQVDAGLPADGGQDRVRLLALDDPFERLGRQRLDVRPVRELRIGHDRGRVRVDQDDAVALVLEGLAGLRSRVVELDGLPDDDRARTDDEDRLDVGPFRHRRG